MQVDPFHRGRIHSHGRYSPDKMGRQLQIFNRFLDEDTRGVTTLLGCFFSLQNHDLQSCLAKFPGTGQSGKSASDDYDIYLFNLALQFTSRMKIDRLVCCQYSLPGPQTSPSGSEALEIPSRTLSCVSPARLIFQARSTADSPFRLRFYRLCRVFVT